MTTVGENIIHWKEEYLKKDIIGKYIDHTLLLLEKFTIEQKLKFLETQPEITREQYLNAFSKED